MTYDDMCPECGSQLYLDTHRAETVCIACGLVVTSSLVIPGTERENSNENRLSSESDMDRLLPQLHFGSYDASGRRVDTNLVRALRRTAKTYNLQSNERSAITIETFVRRLAAQRGIPNSITTRAIYLLRKARELRVVEKPGQRDWALSLLLTASREKHYIVTIRDLVTAGMPIAKNERKRVKRSESNIRRYYNLLKKALDLQIRPPSVSNYITYFSSKLRFGTAIVARANAIAKTHTNPNSAPHCVAAGALYIASEEYGYGLSQKAFCQEVNLSEISLRHWIRHLGGSAVRDNDLPGPKVEDLAPEELWPVEDEHANGEQNAENGGNQPAAPEESERDGHGTDEDREHCDKLDVGEELGHDRKPGTGHAVKDTADAHQKSTYRHNTKVNHETTTRKALLRQGSKAGRPARTSRRAR